MGVISGVISFVLVIWVTMIVTLHITLLITTHEPPSAFQHPKKSKRSSKRFFDHKGSRGVSVGPY